jgi:hypothetical protein
MLDAAVRRESASNASDIEKEFGKCLARRRLVVEIGVTERRKGS